jgi:sugar/nucleoside kinase (ribokinase family)
MPAPWDVVVYGMICLDTIWRVPSLPPPGGYAGVTAERHTIGGEAANTAIALARWGARVALIGNALGDDEEGQHLRALFAREAPEIETRFLTLMPGAVTPAFVCVATDDGHRTTFGRRTGPRQWLEPEPGLVRSARVLTLDAYAGKIAIRACDAAAAAGVPIVAMDCARVPAIQERATIAVTSYEHVGADAPRAAHAAFATALRAAHGLTAIVTLGENGCLIAAQGDAPDAITHVPAYVAPAVVDSTGSGDVFRAGLVFGLLQGWDLLKTARFASAAAALNCGAMGGWCGVGTVAEIERFQQTTLVRPDAQTGSHD